MTTIERASALSGVPVWILRSDCRLRGLCLVRFAAMSAMRRKGMTLPAIGQAMRRDHSTVLSGIRKADAYAARYPRFMAFVEALA